MQHIINNRTIKKIITIVLILSIILNVLLPVLAEATTNNIFGDSITFTSEYIEDEEVMPYALFTPSTATKGKSLSLIVYLHGSGEVDQSGRFLQEKGELSEILNGWSLKGFNAYVLCPHMTGKWNHNPKNPEWNNTNTKNDIDALLSKFIREYNIDTNNIILMGDDIGGYGAIYMADQLPQYFSKLVVVSGYQIAWSNISIPTRGYVGSNDNGTCISFMNGTFANEFGRENVFVIEEATHDTILEKAFYQDDNDNKCSDLIEWMFDGYSGIQEEPFFNKDIIFSGGYVSNGDVMPYALYTPSTASKSKSIPLIVWLHGAGEVGVSQNVFVNQGLPSIMQDWRTEGFNAYVLCPHLAGNWNTGIWNAASAKKNLENLLDEFIKKYNVDTDQIVIVGHSLGGMGALYMAHQLPQYFSKCVSLSGYAPGINISEIKIPTRGYVGMTASGEDSTSVAFMTGLFRSTFGDENTFIMQTNHGGVPKAAFNEDKNGNNRSDLIEWMFEGYSGSESSNTTIDYDESNLVENETTGVNTFAGIILEPTVEFFSFIIDSVISVFSGIMRQEDFEYVMVKKDNIKNLPGEVGTTYTIENMDQYKSATGSLKKIKYPNFKYSPEEIFAGNIDLLDINFIGNSNNDEGWNKIRSVISQWYQILRMIAIIGLLSVLIYTGIKIIISSNTKDKAKYKELIINWFIAVILAFSMHYIMAFILSAIEEITGLLKGMTGVIGVNAGDVTFKTNLIGLARFQIQQRHFTAKVGYLIIYTALVTYTFKFTFVYLKRVLKMAFLTMISPIVALTYPIDKMNDGKAQGFDMWLKEFTFNALLQPMHYILYYILVSSSLSLAANNPIYGIVALMFLSQAEKLLKKIFGFGKARAGTVGGIAGAFATGAITSSLMNHVKSPLHPFGGGKGSSKSGGGNGQLGSGDDYGEIPASITDDINWYDFLGEDILENARTTTPIQQSGIDVTTVSNSTIIGNEDFISRYRQEIPQSELEELSFDDGFGNMESLLRRIYQCENKLADMNIPDDERQKLEQELFILRTALQNRLDFNESGFNDGMYPLQYADGDTRTNSELTNEIMNLWGRASNTSSQDGKATYHANARSLMKQLKRRMSENQYIQSQGGPQALWQQERNKLIQSQRTAPQTMTDQQDNAWEKFTNAPVTRGLKNVGKTIIKPVWDTEKDGKYNGKRLVGNIAKGVAGASVGIAAATVQTGISITDGKYNPMEGIATVGAGIAGVSKLTQKMGEQRKEDIDSIQKYGEQWFNRDDIIITYNREFPGQGKEMRRRAVKNYISRGITDTKDQMQAMKFANQLKNERGMGEEEADKLAIATLQYKKSLVANNSYSILFDTDKKKKYLDAQADAYTGAASRNSVKQLHNDFIENIRDFERANR